MKGFRYPLSEVIRKGLRADESNPRNAAGCIECFNMKPGLLGLLAYSALENPLEEQEIMWPYPQMAITSKDRLVLTANKIYEANSEWIATLKQSSTAGHLWDIVDFGDYLIFCNGEQLVVRDSSGAYTTNNYLSTIPLANSMCNFNGQLIAGGIKSSWYDCAENFVAWGKIGNVDMTPDGSNVAGYRPMPWIGKVLRVMKLGKGVMVYCENGIGLLTPYEQTFSFQELLGSGIPCKGAAGGDEQEHIFIDNQKLLWKVGVDFKLQRLGYQEFIESIQQDFLQVSLNKTLREFYISDGVHSFLLTPFGLCKVYQKVTSVVNDGTNTYGVSNVELYDGDLEAYVVTDTLDFGTTGHKTVESIEFGMVVDEYSVAYGAIDYCYESSGNFTRSPWFMLNPQGQCSPMITAPEIRVAFKCDDFNEVKLDSVFVGIKFPDRRFRRGTYATETTSRAS